MEDNLIKYWPVIVSVILTAVGYGWLQFQVRDNTKDIAELKGDLKQELKEVKSVVTDIKVIVAEMQGYNNRCKEENVRSNRKTR